MSFGKETCEKKALTPPKLPVLVPPWIHLEVFLHLFGSLPLSDFFLRWQTYCFHPLSAGALRPKTTVVCLRAQGGNAMFNELLESSSEKQKTNTGWSVILSALVQISVLL